MMIGYQSALDDTERIMKTDKREQFYINIIECLCNICLLMPVSAN